MATVTYSVENVVPEFIDYYSAHISDATDELDPSVVALADGGFAIAFEWARTGGSAKSILLEIYNADGSTRSGTIYIDTFVSSTSTLDPSITQLSDGRILVTWTDADAEAPGIHYGIVNPTTGAILTYDTKLTGTDSADSVSEVHALQNGGWAIVKQDNHAATDQDADLFIYNSTGTLISSIALGGNSSLDEQNPALTVLANGNIVVAYEKEKTDGTDTFGMAIEVYGPDGSQIKPQYLFDTAGDKNLNPSILGLKDGGFVVVYEDDGWGTNAATAAFFDDSGSFRGFVRVDADGFAESDLSVTQLANGLVYITFTDRPGSDSDIVSALIDPASLTRYFGLNGVEVQSGEQSQSSVTVLENGTIVTTWTDPNAAIGDGNTDPDDTHVSIQIDQIVRTTTGDNTGETLTGDDLLDKMYGEGGDDTLKGMGGNDMLYGGAGNDVLDGGAGADTMTGGADNDTYYVDNINDVVVEANGGGDDKVIATVSYSLVGQSIETLDLSGGNIDGTGNDLGNTIDGTAGNNVIDGKGGVDKMVGHAGNDTYYVDNAADNVVELTGEGNDTVISSVSYSLAGRYVEILSLTGSGNINATGNNQANTLNGNSGNNVLDGKGGVDVMAGGGGNDTYYVDNAGDNVVELDGQGNDTIVSTVSYTLAGRYVETLDLSGGNINGTGNKLANTIDGTAGDNIIDGGAGADRMVGHTGNDTYYVDNAGDNVVELDGEGTDKVISTVSYTLAGRYVETLDLVGSGNVNATGNKLANLLDGNNGNNVLNGMLGNDTLSGKGGADTFVFDQALGTTNVDHITDFSAVDDTIRLENAVFAGLSAGTLSASAFVANTSGLAADASDRIIYETDTGNLYFDRDGSGSTYARVLFAVLDNKTTVTHQDFVVV